MARIKNNITKSGASLLNERTRFYNNQNQQIRQPYIPNGYNTDNLIFEKVYNDQNTIDFNNLKYSNPKKYFNVYPNERNTINAQLATPSTFPDLGFLENNNAFYYNDQKENLEKFLKKGNSIETKFNAFYDKEYVRNIEINQNFIKGENTYSFLDTNLYEETSIEIELDVPVDSLLEYTARMQEYDEAGVNYQFSDWQNSPYQFRQTTELRNRINSPFLIYNFEKNCFESRGWSRVIGNDQNNQSIYEGNEIKEIPNINFVTNPLTLNTQIANLPDTLSHELYTDLKNNLNFNLKNHNFALSHTPIQDLNTAKAPGSDQVGNYFSIPNMQFGFPHFPVFHTFDDNLLSMSKYLNKPLIIDRATVELDVKLKSEITTSQENEDLYIGQGLNFSLNYMILNSPKNFKDSKLRLIVSNPFQLKRDIYAQTEGAIESFNNSPSPFPNFIGGDWPTFLQTHSSNPILSFVFGDFQQNFPVKRKFFKENETDILTSDTFNKSNFNNNIVSFGNVVFHAPHPDNIDSSSGKSYNSNHITELSQLRNNNTLVIDTFTTNSLNLSDLSQDKIYLDYDGKVRLNDYVKKVGNLSLDFAANNINHQFEFFSNTNSTLQLQFELEGSTPSKAIYDSSLNITRNMINNKIDGKDVINTFSFLDFDKKNHGDIPAPIFRKTALNLFNNTFPSNPAKSQDYYFNNIEGNIQTGFYKKPVQEFSPYVLTPDDNLAFCFSISPTIAPKLFKHSCQIKTGKVKFVLHGYMKKNNEIFHDFDNLKNLNQNNLGTSIIANNSVLVNDYNNIGYLDEFVLTFNDRIFQGKFNDDNNVRKLKEGLSTFDKSKILSGKSYIPYTKLDVLKNKKWIYDNDIVFSQILNKLLSTDNQNPNANKYLTPYRGVVDPNIPPSSNNFDKGEIEYFDFNIAAATAPFKLDLKSLEGPITDIKNEFQSTINELLTIPILGAIIAAAFVLDKLTSGGVINKRYNFPIYYNNRKYGQFIDMIQQRLYTTEMYVDTKNTTIINYVIKQKFINDDTGVELTVLTDPQLPLNISKNLQLIDSRNTAWSTEDLFKLKHVAYNDALTEIFI
jgi:hypothetical protein